MKHVCIHNEPKVYNRNGDSLCLDCVYGIVSITLKLLRKISKIEEEYERGKLLK